MINILLFSGFVLTVTRMKRSGFQRSVPVGRDVFAPRYKVLPGLRIPAISDIVKTEFEIRTCRT